MTVVIKVKVIFEKLGIFFINKKCNDAFSHIRSKSLKLVRSIKPGSELDTSEYQNISPSYLVY